MRIIVASVSHPFIRGGAEAHADGLVNALQEAGHEADLVALPFSFFPWSEVLRSQEGWETENLVHPNNYYTDLMIALKYPAYGAHHPNKVVWLLHQHRAAYELFDENTASPEDIDARRAIIDFDTRHLSEARHVFANSHRVAERLQRYNQVKSEPLYHPPPLADRFYGAAPMPYIFCPSRLEILKRQDLLIEAMRFVKSPVVALIAGHGSVRQKCVDLIRQYNLEDRVKMCGYLSEQQKIDYYAHSLGVYFAPFDEDLGYITMEAMLSSKPVITCTDSGGPTELVVNGESAHIVAPRPEAIAEVIEKLWENQTAAIEMGRNARQHFTDLNITWQNAIAKLTKAR